MSERLVMVLVVVYVVGLVGKILMLDAGAESDPKTVTSVVFWPLVFVKVLLIGLWEILTEWD